MNAATGPPCTRRKAKRGLLLGVIPIARAAARGASCTRWDYGRPARRSLHDLARLDQQIALPPQLEQLRLFCLGCPHSCLLPDYHRMVKCFPSLLSTMTMDVKQTFSQMRIL
jgi:hypothetical protein